MSKVDFSRLRETAASEALHECGGRGADAGTRLVGERGQVGHEFVAGQWRHGFPARFNGDREVVVQFIVVKQCPEEQRLRLSDEALAASR